MLFSPRTRLVCYSVLRRNSCDLSWLRWAPSEARAGSGSQALARHFRLKRRHFPQPPQVTRCLTEFGPEKGLDKIPSDQRSNGTAAHTYKVHVVVLDSLPSREVVVHQRRAYSRYLVRTDRSSHAASADGNAARDCPGGNGLSERDDKIRIIVVRVKATGSEIDHFMPCRTETS